MMQFLFLKKDATFCGLHLFLSHLLKRFNFTAQLAALLAVLLAAQLAAQLAARLSEAFQSE